MIGNRQGRWVSSDGRLLYSTHMGYNEPDYDADNPIYRGGQPVEEHDYLTDALTREAVDFISRSADRPFLLYLAYNAVHSPLQGTDEYMRRFEHIEDVHRRIFAAMLSNLDGETSEATHDVLFWRTGAKAALRAGEWKLLRNPARDQPGDWQLFKLDDDVSETKDLATDRQEMLRELVAKWQNLNAEMSEPVWRPSR